AEGVGVAEREDPTRPCRRPRRELSRLPQSESVQLVADDGLPGRERPGRASAGHDLDAAVRAEPAKAFPGRTAGRRTSAGEPQADLSGRDDQDGDECDAPEHHPAGGASSWPSRPRILSRPSRVRTKRANVAAT